MFDPRQFTAPKAKPLPVFLLLDVSGSMNQVVDPENVVRTGRTLESDGKTWEVVEGGTSKIRVLNDAVRRMIDSFAAEERSETGFLVSIITFGDQAVQLLSPQSASSVQWADMQADGNTALGSALSLVKNLIEDKDVIPSRAYRPTVVLVSDGQPTDVWEQPLEALITSGRSAKCFFMAMGIGENPGKTVLERFISQTPVLAEVDGTPIPNTVFHAMDAEKMHEFFEKVTMSVTTRSKSANPNAVPTSAEPNLEEGGYW
jgi:uncharacterized protein YegL